MSMTHYLALADGVPGAFGVVFPDAPGCTSMAATRAQALQQSVHALREWLETNESPPARNLEELLMDSDVREQIADGSTLEIVSV